MASFEAARFAKWLEAAFRRSSYKSYSELAEAAGLKRSTVSSLVTAKPQTATGRPSRPKDETVVRLANALGEDVDNALLIAGHAPRRGSVIMPPKNYEELLRALEHIGIEISWAEIDLQNATPQDFADLFERIRFDTEFSLRRKAK